MSDSDLSAADRVGRSAPAAVVVMGVAGAGKSTLGRALALALQWRFVEGDALHPPANVAKMAAGVPLRDEDRWPYLAAVAAAVRAASGAGVVAACSALKRRYRDVLRAQAGDITFVLPLADRDTLHRRLTRRSEHFMPASLLDSQLADLEPPAADERAIVVDGTAATSEQVTQICAAMKASGALPNGNKRLRS